MIMIRDCIAAACQEWGVPRYEMTGPSRCRPLSTRRQMAMAAARMLTGASYPQIGKHFGGRDHTTVLFAYRKITSDPRYTPEFRRVIERAHQIAIERAQALRDAA